MPDSPGPWRNDANPEGPECRQRDCMADAPVASIGRWSRLPQTGPAPNESLGEDAKYHLSCGRTGNLSTLTDLPDWPLPSSLAPDDDYRQR